MQKDGMPIPPKGLREDFYRNTMSIRDLCAKYQIGVVKLYRWANRLEWKTTRPIKKMGVMADGESTIWWDKSLKHLPPTPPSFSEIAKQLKNFPRHWRDPDVNASHQKDTYDPTKKWPFQHGMYF